MFIPIRTDSPLRVTPYMNWAIILLNVAAYVAQRSVPGFESALKLYPKDPAIFAFFGYQFLHANLMHLLGNMLFLYIFGNNVNDKIGHVGYLAFYLASCVASGIGYVLLPQVTASVVSSTPVIGASGAVAAVTGAYLSLFPRSNITIFTFFLVL